MSRKIGTVIKQQLLSELHTFRREFDRQATPQDELIHTTRVTIKRLRAVLALVKKEIGGERYRSDTLVAKALAEHLAGSRDASVAVHTLAGLLQQQEAPTLPQRQLLGLLEAASQKSVAALDRVQITWMLNELLQSLQEWRLDRFGNKQLQRRTDKLFSRSRRHYRLALTQGTAQSYHTWRKHHKRYYLLLELLQQSDKPTRKAYKKLGSLLGKLHDLQVLNQWVATRWPELLPELKTLADPAQQQLQEEIRQRAELLYRGSTD